MSRRLPALLLALVLTLTLLTGCSTLRGIREDMLADESEETTDAVELSEDTPAAPETEAQQTPTVTAASADPTEAMYSAYREIVQQREAQYGRGECVQPSSGGTYYWMRGVAYVGLRDLDRDGVEELLLWENTLVNDFPAAANIELWTWRGGSAVKLYSGFCRAGGDPSGQCLELSSIDGETMLVLGEYGAYADLEYHAVRDGRLVLVHTLVEDDNTYDGFFYDGVKISVADGQSILDRSEYLCNAGEDVSDANAILNATGAARVRLGL